MTVSERKTSKSSLDPTKTYFILEFFVISTILSLFKKIWLLENSILENVQTDDAIKKLTDYLFVAILIWKENVTADVTKEALISVMKATQKKCTSEN